MYICCDATQLGNKQRSWFPSPVLRDCGSWLTWLIMWEVTNIQGAKESRLVSQRLGRSNWSSPSLVEFALRPTQHRLWSPRKKVCQNAQFTQALVHLFIHLEPTTCDNMKATSLWRRSEFEILVLDKLVVMMCSRCMKIGGWKQNRFSPIKPSTRDATSLTRILRSVC